MIGQTVDLHVSGGRVVGDTGVHERQLYIADGRVVAVAERPLPIQARRTLNLAGEWVWPGFVDTHVHFADPGFTEREDFATGTRAALAGGVTTVVEMPNTDPVVANAAAVDVKLAAIAPKAYVDFGLWGALLPDGGTDIVGLRERGVRLVKGFLGYMGVHRARGMARISDWDLLSALRQSRDLDVVIAVHPENHDLIKGASDSLATQPASRYGEDHPLVAEEEAVVRSAFLAGRVGGRLHIVHASGGSIVRHVKEARERGVRISSETCPQYLAFCEDDGRARGVWLRCAPPLRSAQERDDLWERLSLGQVDLVVSDHSPATIESKRAAESDLLQAPNGLTGVQTLVPYMISSAVRERRLPPQLLYALMSKNPARFAGLYPRKGALLPGSDADFTVVDMDASWTLSADDLHYKHKWSPWTDARFTAKVRRVYVRGVEAMVGGEITLAPGFGRFLPAEEDTQWNG